MPDHNLPAVEAPAEYANLPLLLIDEDPHNIRTRRDAALDEAFNASVAAIGIVVPIMVRPAKKGRYMIVHGHRRFRAASLAGHDTIPATIRAMDDAAARLAQGAENMARARMSELDQWRAVVVLQDRHGWDIATAARALGQGEPLVRRMDRVGRCHPDVFKLMEKLGVPPDAQLAKIAMAPLDVQREAIKATKNANDSYRWQDIARACTVDRIAAKHAIWDWKAPNGPVRFEEDLFGQGGEDAWTTTDIAGFLDAQAEALKLEVTRRAETERILMVGWSPTEVRPLIPAEYQDTHRHDDGKPIGKKAKVTRIVSVARSGYRIGQVVSVIAERKPKPAAKEASKGGKAGKAGAAEAEADPAPIVEPRTKPPISQRGADVIAAEKTRAIRTVLTEGPTFEADTVIALLVLTLSARNVSIHGDPDNRYRATDVEDLVAGLLTPEGGMRQDGLEVVQRIGMAAVARCMIASGPSTYHSSGDAAEWVGRLIGAAARLPRFDTAEFLEHVSGAELRRLAATQGGALSGITKVGDLRRALVGKLPEWVPDIALFSAPVPEPETPDAANDAGSDGIRGDEANDAA